MTERALIETESSFFVVRRIDGGPLTSPAIDENGLIGDGALPTFLTILTNTEEGRVRIVADWLGGAPFPQCDNRLEVHGEVSVQSGSSGLSIGGLSDDQELLLEDATGWTRLKVVETSSGSLESYRIYARSQPETPFVCSEAARNRFSGAPSAMLEVSHSIADAVGRVADRLAEPRNSITGSGTVRATDAVSGDAQAVHNAFVGLGWSCTFTIGPQHIGEGRQFYRRDMDNRSLGGRGAVHVFIRRMSRLEFEADWQWLARHTAHRIPITEMVPLLTTAADLRIRTTPVAAGARVELTHSGLPDELVGPMQRFWGNEMEVFTQRLGDWIDR